MSSLLTEQQSWEHGKTVGWIGLGSMGLAMAFNVQRELNSQGLPKLKYWNRTISKGDTLKEIGGEPCTSPGDVATRSKITFISVSTFTRMAYIH